MNNITAVTLVASLLSVVITAGTALWRNRTTGPAASSQIVTASTTLLDQLQDRIEVLEYRVLQIENENAQYRALYGPLPRLKQAP